MSNNHIISKDQTNLKKIFFDLIANERWDSLIELINLNMLDINYRDEKGRNALFWAIHFFNVSAIEKLVRLGINQNVTNNLSSVNYAVYKDNVKLIKCLKNSGIDIHEADDINSTPLIYAILYNKLNSINYLIENGADIFHEDFLGNTPISLAYDLKIRYLIDKFSKISK